MNWPTLLVLITILTACGGGARQHSDPTTWKPVEFYRTESTMPRLTIVAAALGEVTGQPFAEVTTGGAERLAYEVFRMPSAENFIRMQIATAAANAMVKGLTPVEEKRLQTVLRVIYVDRQWVRPDANSSDQVTGRRVRSLSMLPSISFARISSGIPAGAGFPWQCPCSSVSERCASFSVKSVGSCRAVTCLPSAVNRTASQTTSAPSREQRDTDPSWLPRTRTNRTPDSRMASRTITWCRACPMATSPTWSTVAPCRPVSVCNATSANRVASANVTSPDAMGRSRPMTSHRQG